MWWIIIAFFLLSKRQVQPSPVATGMGAMHTVPVSWDDGTSPLNTVNLLNVHGVPPGAMPMIPSASAASSVASGGFTAADSDVGSEITGAMKIMQQHSAVPDMARGYVY